MNVLIADDEAPKLENLSELVLRLHSSVHLSHARSVKATIATLRDKEIDFLILDMSLPTFAVAPGEPGGRPQNFGGVEVLRRMQFYDVKCPTLVVTQYEAFPHNDGLVDLSELENQLYEEYGDFFFGCVYYGAASGNWEAEIAKRMTKFFAGSAS